MRIILISDTHNIHNNKDLNEKIINSINIDDTNILIHSGDFTYVGKIDEVSNFIQWFENLKGFDYKIFISGNHELTFENKPEWLLKLLDESKLKQSNCVYLEDKEFIFKNVKFYGSPWQPWFYNWAFNLPRNGKELDKVWEKIPENTDVLITHSPPYGILDKTNMTKGNTGCERLLERLNNIKPKIHVFGHIHSARNIIETEDTLYINASILNDKYDYKYNPIIIDFDENNKKIINIKI